MTTVPQSILIRRKVLQWFDANATHMTLKEFGFDRSLLRNLWPSTWRSGIISCGSFMINYGSTVVISQISNATLISEYLVTHRIANLTRQIAQTPLYARLPELFHLFAKYQIQEIRNILGRTFFFSLSSISLFFLVLGIVGNPLFTVLEFQTRLLSGGLYALLCFVIVLEMHHSMHAQVYMSTNHVPFLLPSIISGALILGLDFMVVDSYGLVGLLLIQFAVQASFNNWYPVKLSCKLVGWTAKTYFLDLIKGAEYFVARLKAPFST